MKIVDNVIRLIPMVSYHRFINGKRYLRIPDGTYLVGATTWPIVDGRMAILRHRRSTAD